MEKHPPAVSQTIVILLHCLGMILFVMLTLEQHPCFPGRQFMFIYKIVIIIYNPQDMVLIFLVMAIMHSPPSVVEMYM